MIETWDDRIVFEDETGIWTDELNNGFREDKTVD